MSGFLLLSAARFSLNSKAFGPVCYLQNCYDTVTFQVNIAALGFLLDS